MDALITLTDFIQKESLKENLGHLPKSVDDAAKDPQKKVFQKDRTKRSLTNVLRRLILRIQPYMSPTNSSASLAYKSLQTFQNCVPYLAGREMITELEADTFSTEDSSNVLISCALSAISYELLPNFAAILKSTMARQQKIKMFEVLAHMA